MRPRNDRLKGVSFFNSVGGNVVAQVTGMGDNPSLSRTDRCLEKVMLQAYDEGRLDKLLHCQQQIY